MISRGTRAWLADPSEPASRYRYLVEIAGARPGSKEAREARTRIPAAGWAARILSSQRPDGFWVQSRGVRRPKYVSTYWQMMVLADMRTPGDDPRVRRGLKAMMKGFGLKHQPFGDPAFGPHHCITGNTARLFIELGHGDAPHVRRSLEWLADEQHEDGGWDCFGRDKSTLDCWEALSAWAALPKGRMTPKWSRAVERGAEFYLRNELRKEGGKRYAAWERIHYPNHYYYDLLLGLEILTRLGFGDDRRLRPVLSWLKKKRRADGTWSIENIPPDLAPGNDYGTAAQVRAFLKKARRLTVEPVGVPSKWVTLRALGVLKRVG
jgi:hypothetical protein